MVVQHVVSERLRTAGFSFVTSFHDIANAFPSMQHNHIQTATDAVVKDADRNLLRQRIGETAMVVEASDGRVVVSPKCGTLQGDSIAGDVFTEGYHSILDAWNARLHGLGPPFRITAFSPFDLSDQDLAVTAYADDVCRKILVSSPQTASVRVQQSNAILDEELAKATMAQNVDKQQHIAVFKGTNSRRYTKYITQHGMQDGTAVFQARYLGGLQRFDGQCGPEIEVRAKAAYVSWCTFKGLWHRRELPRRGLRSVFLGMVYEVLLAGVDALVLGRRHYDKLDRIVTAYGRRLMRGTACEKTEDEHGQIHYRSVPNSAVFRYLGIASSRVELRIRRLKFLQRLARDPCKHHQVITAIFGTMFFDAEPTIQSDGGLSTYANSYAKTYWEDIQALQSLDSAYWLVDMANGEVLPFFSELAEEFVHVDVSELRAQANDNGNQPPTKMRALSTGEDAETVRKALLLVSKMTLRQELEIRELQSAVFKTFVVREPNPIISTVKAEVGSYLEKAKMARSSGGSLPEGEVHAYAWAALTQVAVQQETLDGTSKAVIDSHRAAMASPDMIADVVYIAKLKKAFNKGEFKLFLAVSPAHHGLLEESLNSALAHLWSVSVEMQMYLLTPILCELIFDRKAGKRRPWAYALLALISLASMALRGFWILGPPQMLDSNRWGSWPPPPHYINTFARISPYLSGITLQLVLDEEKAQEGNKAEEAEAGNASLMLARAARAFGGLLLDLAAVAVMVLSGLFGCYYLPAPSFMDEVLGARGKQCSVAFWPPLFGWSLARCLYHILTAAASRLNPWYWCQQFLGRKLWFHVALLSYSAYVMQNHAVLPLIMLDESLRLNWSGLGRGDAPLAMVRYTVQFFLWTLCCCLVALPCHVFVEVPGMRLGRMLDRALRRCCQKSCKGLGPKVEVVRKEGAACRDSGVSEIVSTDTSASSCV
ncbi:unnamed protein product [Symbiodinium microadriaticum]|nr:unnamed protein product [Symbiodinium microadriaticum]